MSGSELRPHHALCIGFFRGSGYSDAFVENMTAIVAALHASDPLLTLHCGSDRICRACPHDRHGVCESAEKVSRYDAAALRLLGLSEGATLRRSELCELVRTRILAPGRLGEVCGDCQWFSLCGGTR